jgi:hypothetical protein
MMLKQILFQVDNSHFFSIVYLYQLVMNNF